MAREKRKYGIQKDVAGKFVDWACNDTITSTATAEKFIRAKHEGGTFRIITVNKVLTATVEQVAKVKLS